MTKCSQVLAVTTFFLLLTTTSNVFATPYIDGTWRGNTVLTADTCGGLPGATRHRFRIRELFRNTLAAWIDLWEGDTYTAGRWTARRKFYTTNGFEGSNGRLDVLYEFSRVRSRRANLRVTTYITSPSGAQCGFQYSGRVRRQ